MDKFYQQCIHEIEQKEGREIQRWCPDEYINDQP